MKHPPNQKKERTSSLTRRIGTSFSRGLRAFRPPWLPSSKALSAYRTVRSGSWACGRSRRRADGRSRSCSSCCVAEKGGNLLRKKTGSKEFWASFENREPKIQTPSACLLSARKHGWDCPCLFGSHAQGKGCQKTQMFGSGLTPRVPTSAARSFSVSPQTI